MKKHQRCQIADGTATPPCKGPRQIEVRVPERWQPKTPVMRVCLFHYTRLLKRGWIQPSDAQIIGHIPGREPGGCRGFKRHRYDDKGVCARCGKEKAA